MAESMYTSDRRLYLNDKDEVVEANDPSRVTLLVGVGGQIPLADAGRYGLTGEQAKAKAPEANKSKKAPDNK